MLAEFLLVEEDLLTVLEPEPLLTELFDLDDERLILFPELDRLRIVLFEFNLSSMLVFLLDLLRLDLLVEVLVGCRLEVYELLFL